MQLCRGVRWALRPGAAVLLVLAWLGVAAGAQAASIEVTVDRTEATLEDELNLSVAVHGSRSATPAIPELPDFEVVPRGQSTQVRIINGSIDASVVYNYILVPKRAGNFSIGAFTVTIDGRTYASRPFVVRIIAAGAAGGAVPGAGPGSGSGAGDAAPTAPARDLFITATVSKTNPVVGEQIIYTWRLFRRVQVTNPALELPDFAGFTTQDLGKEREYRVVENGQAYVVTELRKALFAQQPGKLTVGPSNLAVEVVRGRRGGNDFFMPFGDIFGGPEVTTPKRLRTAPLEVQVQSLPPAPANFSGLIGNFNIRAELSSRSVKVGESTTLTLTISGTGNAQGISEPALPALDQCKIYDDKPTATLNTEGELIAGSKAFRKALVPLRAGTLRLEPITLTYFDPEARIYRTASTAALAIEVAPGEASEELKLTEGLAPSGAKVAVKILADDIVPIYKGLDAVAHHSGAPALLPLWGGLLVLPPGFALLLAWRRRRAHHLVTHADLHRSRRALQRCRKELAAVRAALSRGEMVVAAQAGSRTLRQYLGDKLGIEGLALTPHDVRRHLEGRGLQAELLERTAALLQRCEAAQYGAAEEAALGQLGSELNQLLGDLEKELRA